MKLGKTWALNRVNRFFKRELLATISCWIARRAAGIVSVFLISSRDNRVHTRLLFSFSFHSSIGTVEVGRQSRDPALKFRERKGIIRRGETGSFSFPGVTGNFFHGVYKPQRNLKSPRRFRVPLGRGCFASRRGAASLPAGLPAIFTRRAKCVH